jgi:hypothetical protein
MSSLSNTSLLISKIKEVYGFYSDLLSGKENKLWDKTLTQVSDRYNINREDLKDFIERFDKGQLNEHENAVVKNFYLTLSENMLKDPDFHNLYLANKFIQYDSILEEIRGSISIKDQHTLVDETDTNILKALSKFGRSYTPVRDALGDLGIEEVELGDRLDSLAKRGLVQVAKGTQGPGSLSNGIYNVGITGEGRTFLRERGLL